MEQERIRKIFDELAQVCENFAKRRTKREKR